MKRSLLQSLFTAALISAATIAAAQEPHPILDVTGFDQNRDYFSEAPFEHIDTLSGGLVLTFTDLVLPGNAGRELRFQRTYNSKNGRWTFGIAGLALYMSHGVELSSFPPGTEFQGGAPAPHMSDGSARRMAWAQRPMPGVPTTFYEAISSQFWRYHRPSRTLTMADGTRCLYAENPDDPLPSGRLRASRCTDSFGNVTLFAWGPAAAPSLQVRQCLNGFDEPLLSCLSESRTVDIAFNVTVAGFPTTMSYDGRTWTYEGIASVTPPIGPGWQYTYDGLNLVTVTTPHGGVITYTYENQQYAGPDPGVEYFTLVVRRRAASGRLPAGTWEYTYLITEDGLSAETTVVMPVVIPSGHRVRYRHGDGVVYDPDGVFDGVAGLVPLTERLVQECVGATCVDVERETRAYRNIQVLTWTAFGILEPWTRTITRYVGASTQVYTTDYRYNTADFGDYHRPNLITEIGSAGTRTTTRTYQHLLGSYILGLPASERITVGTESFDKAWSYDPATGFKTAETIYEVTTTFAPDPFGNVERATKANGKFTRYTYQWGLLKDVITAEHTTTRVINPQGTVASQTQAGRTTTFTYDDVFRVTQVTPPGGTNPIVTAYDPLGEWVRVTRGTSGTTTTIDGLGRPIATVDNVGVRTTTEYDAEGRKVYEGYPFVGVADIGTSLTYDALGRVTRRTNPDASFSTRTHGLGTVVLTDENTRETTQTFEAFGDPDQARLIAVRDADARTWQYTYNAIDRLRTVRAPDGSTRTWEYYPGKELLQRETHPESGATAYVYDPAGVLTQTTDAKGTQFVYTHDGNDRIQSMAGGGQTTLITYEPDSDNRRTASVGGVSTDFQYDPAGRRDRRTDTLDGKTFRTTHEYDGNDRVRAIEYATATGTSRRRVGVEHDAEGRITRIFEGAQTYASAFTYHPSGAVLTYTGGNGVVNAFTFDPQRYWPTSLSAAGWQLQYQNYDGVGNVRTITDSRPTYTQTFTYDVLDRLETATGIYGLATYAYDGHGNRTTAGGTTYTYDPATLRLTQQGPTSFSYDPNGNTLTAGPKTFTYTPDNMMATATGDGINAAYTYDADQWRIKKTELAIPTYFLRGLGGELLTEWRSLGATAQVKDYVYAGARLILAITRDVTEGPACPTTTDIVNLDFESGQSLAALGFERIIDISNQSGEGLRGSTWGVRGNPGATASQKYFGEAALPVTHSGRHFRAEADFDHADASENRFGYQAFMLATNGGGSDAVYLRLHHGVGDADPLRDKLVLYLPNDAGPSSPVWVSGGGLIVPGTTQQITVCGTLSTVDGTTINPDGSVSVYVDGVLRVALTGKKIANTEAFGGGTLKKVFINPMGRFDNFKVSQ